MALTVRIRLCILVLLSSTTLRVPGHTDRPDDDR